MKILILVAAFVGMRIIALRIMALILLALPQHAGAGAPPKDLLDCAKREIDANAENFIAREGVDALFAKLSILESQTDPQPALDRARAIKSPFYAVLALGGIAATEIQSSPSDSKNHFSEALVRSLTINSWTGRHPTSLCFLFGLIPVYPKDEAVVLLTKSKDAFDAWQASDYQKQASLLAFAKATIAVSPSNAEPLLLEVAMKSNHYWDSIEHIAGFLARQSPERALRLAEAHYQARKDWPNDQNYLRAVLIELATADFPRAFKGIRAMRDMDREIAAVKLADVMLEAKRRPEVGEIVAYLSGLKSDFSFTKESLDRLRRRLAEEATSPVPATSTGPDLIDQFLKEPTSTELQSLTRMESVAFRDKRQAVAFVTAALPVVETIRDMGYPHHGSPRSTAFGLLVLCSAAARETDKALEIVKRIDIPEARISYLLDAYEQVNPMPAPVAQWPIHFWQRPRIVIHENGQGATKGAN